MRVVSLLASGTEIVCALGCGDTLIARSHECDYPPEITALPQITAPKFVLDGRSYEIDQRIKAILAEGLAIYRVDVEALAELRPEVIITQVQCEVCAVSLSDVQAALSSIVGYSPRLVALNPNSLSDVWNDIRAIASQLGVAERGERLVDALKDEMADLRSRRQQGSGARPRVACIEWLSPLMAAGNWMPELVEMAGGENLFGEAGKHSPWMSFVELEAAKADIVLLLPCGFDISRTEREFEVLRREERWHELAAAKSGRIYVLDGNQYFNRPGPRLVDSLEILLEVFSENEKTRFVGVGWKPLEAL